MPSEINGLDAARAALDRRQRRERRDIRHARRRRRRLLWTIGFVGLINVAAWAALDTPGHWLQIDTLLGWDKFEHFIVFLAGTLITIVFLSRWISAGIQALILLNVGLIIEILQAYDSKRTADVVDFAFDQLGILAGWLLFRLYRRLSGQTRNRRTGTRDRRAV